MNKIIGIGGINAAKEIAINKIVLFSIILTNLGLLKALNVAKTYIPRYEASIIDLNSQICIHIYL